MTKIIIVDENNEIIGSKERFEVCLPDIYRATGLWITNSKGEILLAQRSFNKSHDPGKWGPAVSGTVEEGETYEENIQKEAREELGVSDLELVEGPVTRKRGVHDRFSQWFFAELDQDIADFRIQKDEVEQIKWFTRQELEIEIAENPEHFLQSIPERLKQFTNR